MAHLHVVSGPLKGQRLPLHKERTVLGRDSKCDIVITGDAVSRTHATISRTQEKYYIADGDGSRVKSRSGTLRNKDLVPFPGRVPLKDHDSLQICDVVFTFRESAGETGQADDKDDSSSIEASISHRSSQQVLETQPAERLKVILEISNILSKTLDLGLLLPRIIESLFQLFKQADRGFLILVDTRSGKLVLRVKKTRRPQDEPDARFSSSIANECLATVKALLCNEADKQFPMAGSVIGSLRSVMCAPLWSQDGTALGSIQLDTKDSRRKFTEEDLNLLLGVASQASIALVNAKLYEDSRVLERLHRDLEVARLVQRAFLPQVLPEVPGYEFFASSEPALEVGGDYYDFIVLPGQRLGLLLGDVMGKGISAALVMVKFSTLARSCLLSEPDPAAAISKLNVLMSDGGLAQRFVTLVAAVLDPLAHTATLVNAGHPLALLLHQTTGNWEEATPLESSGMPIGIVEGCEYTSCQVRLEAGDTLVFFSDGVSEALDMRSHQFGKQGISAVLRQGIGSPRRMGERILEAVRQHAAGCGHQYDDITLLCFGRTC